MNTLIFFTLAVLSTASASIIGLDGTLLTAPAVPAVSIQGPSAQAALAGPDGSAIAAASQGGSVTSGGIPGGLISAAVAPGVVATAPAALWGAPALIGPAGTVVAGPSGTIVTNGLTSNLITVPRFLIG